MAYAPRYKRGPLPIFVPYNAKIADITHADTNVHLLTLANAAGTGAIAGETRTIIAVIVSGNRMAGTGYLRTYPNEGGFFDYSSGSLVGTVCVIANGLQRLQYSLTVANDDFDLYCLGYVVEA